LHLEKILAKKTIIIQNDFSELPIPGSNRNNDFDPMQVNGYCIE